MGAPIMLAIILSTVSPHVGSCGHACWVCCRRRCRRRCCKVRAAAGTRHNQSQQLTTAAAHPFVMFFNKQQPVTQADLDRLYVGIRFRLAQRFAKVTTVVKQWLV